MGVARLANRMGDWIDFADEGSGLVGHEFASDNVSAVAIPAAGDTAVKRGHTYIFRGLAWFA